MQSLKSVVQFYPLRTERRTYESTLIIEKLRLEQEQN